MCAALEPYCAEAKDAAPSSPTNSLLSTAVIVALFSPSVSLALVPMSTEVNLADATPSLSSADRSDFVPIELCRQGLHVLGSKASLVAHVRGGHPVSLNH